MNREDRDPELEPALADLIEDGLLETVGENPPRYRLTEAGAGLTLAAVLAWLFAEVETMRKKPADEASK